MLLSGDHTDDDRALAKARERTLGLLKDALLDLHYLENEIRLEYLAGLAPGVEPDRESLRDPARTLAVRFKRLAQARQAARSSDDPRGACYTPYTDMGRAALDHLGSALVDLEAREVAGDLVECGVGRGGGGMLLRAVLEACDIEGRSLWIVDPFLASDPDAPTDHHPARTRLRADLNQVRDGFDRFGLLDERVRFLQGRYADVLVDAPIERVALLRIGVEATYDLGTVLGRLLPRMSDGGTVIVEGVGRPAFEKRVAEFRDRRGVHDPIERVDWNTVAWRVSGRSRTRPGSDDAPEVSRTLHRVPLAPAVPTGRLDLTVVVVFYDMAREAARTLRSLTRTYQRDIDDLQYEVLAIDNGSHPDQRLRAEDVAAYGPEFRLITLDDASPSPTQALNRGIAESRGDTVALMIDGAHVLTPRVLHHARTAMATYEPAVVAVQQWYVGPGQQGDAQQAGYDQEFEDGLFRNIRWPTDGYRLFEIGHFIGDRDWFDGIIESNCLFAPRSLLEQVGGFDDSFDMPGGGYANLELFERLHSHPGVNPTSILGEGTFHQFHGGTTTNVADEAVRRARIASYGEHFAATRGRGLMGLSKPVHYVGSMDTGAARRTRSRREFLLAFEPDRDPVASTEEPPRPVPEELKLASIEALWQNQSWREATWLGHRVARYPTDLHSYQELMSQLRSDVIVFVGDDVGLGGRALFAASVADQLGHGRVLAVGRPSPGPRPAHPRVAYLEGEAEDPEVIARVAAQIGEDPALVLLGLGPLRRVTAAFEAYAPFVPVGGYVVVENTVVNGRPVASSFGPGPHEAVSALLRRRPEFVPDVAFERYTVTFNKNGYLRRTALS